MTKLSVNINKIATIRNSRGGDMPNIVDTAVNAERFGAEGITVHPRPDERHIRYADVYDLKRVVKSEFNIEGNPIDKFVDMVTDVVPTQVTLVPDAHDAITSNNGWDTKANVDFLTDIISHFHRYGIRTSIFLNPDPETVYYAAKCGVDRIELYTEEYANEYRKSPERAIAPYIATAVEAQNVGLGINAGHDLNLENLQYFARTIPGLLEVSIGHALISDALYFGMENTIQMYLNKLRCTL